MTIVPKKKSDSRPSKSAVVGPKPDEHDDDHHQDHHHSPLRQQPCEPSAGDSDTEDYSGYNSGDEYSKSMRRTYLQWTDEEFEQKEIQFENNINQKGWIIRKMAEDGACLFRAVADQIYGDQDMHSVLRKLCMDYIVSI